MTEIKHGDALELLSSMDSAHFDSMVTDPPAGISFMGKDWDDDKGGRGQWIAWMTSIMKECHRVLKPGAHALVWALPRTSHWTATALEDAGFEVRDVVTHLFGTGFPKSHNLGNGWGTALKPASEHWILVRKPCSEKTVASNVLKHGTGGINIDASRVEGSFASGWSKSGSKASSNLSMSGPNIERLPKPDSVIGRFPANLVLDETAAEMLDSASRFFYVAKASKSDKGAENTHPTVKSTKLMEYLIKLITPNGGVVLDPFMGSGSTGVAAKKHGFRFVGIEKDEGYVNIALRRMND